MNLPERRSWLIRKTSKTHSIIAGQLHHSLHDHLGRVHQVPLVDVHRVGQVHHEVDVHGDVRQGHFKSHLCFKVLLDTRSLFDKYDKLKIFDKLKVIMLADFVNKNN